MERRYLLVAVALVVFAAVYFADIGIPDQPRHILAIVIFAAILWLTEALPLHVTGLFAAFLLATTGGLTPNQVFPPFFDPIIALFLGVFILALGMQKHGLDRYLASALISRVGTKPRTVMLAMMVMAAFLAMWLSNTASTALMLAIAIPVLRDSGASPKSSFAKALVLGIAFAAPMGGLSSLVGTPPNMIAVKFLADADKSVSFLGWFSIGFPIALVLLPCIWIVLSIMFKQDIRRLRVVSRGRGMTSEQKKVLLIFIATVILLATSGLHGIPNYVTALVPIILLYMFGLLDTDDFSKIRWHTLILFGSGLSIGSAMGISGLDKILASSLGSAIIGQPAAVVLLAVSLVCVALTSFASNTATAAILVPIVIPMASVLGVDMTALAVLVAMSVSIDYITPVGTPPNAIACSSGYVRPKDLAKAGIVISIIAVALLVIRFSLLT